MDTIIWILYVFISCRNQRILPLRDARLQEVLNSRKSRKFFSETSLDMCGENRKFMMKWDFPDESSDCHVISDELVFEVKFVSKVCQ